MRELADYLRFLTKNSTAYLEHFEWAKRYSLRRPALYGEQYCQICRNAHDNGFHKVYEDIANFFGPERRCDNDLVPRLLNTQLKEEEAGMLSGIFG
jgi:hypothetical protein